MKILLACLNANGLGGSELYHYELARELYNLGCDVTLFTLHTINREDQVRLKIQHIKQVDLNTINLKEQFDILVASQPQVNLYLLEHFNTVPIISIIHSEIRSEDPVIHPRIIHYIAIREPIKDMLINEYKISEKKISVIYNPIDQTRFNETSIEKLKTYSGLFVGEVLDPIRFQAVKHLTQECINNTWDLYLMSDSRYNFNHPNIKYLDKRWDTEHVVKQMHFTAGILLGRTTLEGWCCGVPGFIYLIDVQGNILDIQTTAPDDIQNLCDSKTVAKQHIKLYSRYITD